MTKAPAFDVSLAHKTFAGSCFNGTWELIDKVSELSADEIENMIHLAHASYWHWSRVDDATPENLSIGAWQLARVYAVAGRPANATHYGQICLELSRTHDLKPFFTAYAYEALARAAFVSGRVEEVKLLVAEACREGEAIEEEDNRNQLMSDLATISVDNI